MDTKSATSVFNEESDFKSKSSDILDSCRLCMECNKNMKDMFAAEHSNIIEKVQFCTGLQLSQQDGLPSHICEACTHNLTVAYNFKTTCLASDKTYRNLIPKVKIENAETDFDNHFDDIDDENDCKDVLKEMLKLNDIKISRVKLKSENNGSAHKLQKQHQVKRKASKLQTRALKKSEQNDKKAKLVKLHCDVCNMSFKTKEEFTEHKKIVHKEVETFVCEVCGKVMLHRASLYTHMQSHLPPRHACDKCDYKTGHKYDLVKHRRIHSGIKLYQCEFCTAAYHTSSNLRCHIRQNHEGTPRKKFACRLCDRSFFDRTKLKRHVDAHNDIKRYECEVCHSCFARRCYWKKHMDRQHGVVIPPTRPGRRKVNLLIGEDQLKTCSENPNSELVTV